MTFAYVGLVPDIIRDLYDRTRAVYNYYSHHPRRGGNEHKKMRYRAIHCFFATSSSYSNRVVLSDLQLYRYDRAYDR